MRTLFKILLFLPLLSSGQNLHTNAPDLVYPILEEFISENHLRGTASFEKINYIDSIVVKDIPLIVQDHMIKKVYGKWYRVGKRHWIEIDSTLLPNRQKFEKTLTHELGHLFGLGHILPPNNTPYDNEIYDNIMCIPSLPYYIPEERFRIAKDKFYNTLKNPTNEKPDP